MFSAKIIKGNKIEILTDDPTVENFLKGDLDESGYNVWTKKFGAYKTTVHIFERGRHNLGGGKFKYILGLGWAAYVMSAFSNVISLDDWTCLRNAITSSEYRDIPFPNLRDYQNSDVLFLLKYKIGLFQVNTSYGKTETIATLANYFVGSGKRVLLVTPGNKARDELIKRAKLRFSLEVSKDLGEPICCIITSGILRRKENKGDSGIQQMETVLASYDVVLVDEVEYTINPSGEFIYSKLVNATNFYGFSGTADKYTGAAVTFAQGLSDTVLKNRNLIKYFGPALVFRLPLNMSIDDIVVNSRALDNLVLDNEAIESAGNVYGEIMNQLWTDPDVCETIVKIVKRFPKTFIPMNNLVTILDGWINNYFIGTFRILLVCGKGYIYYDLEGNKKSLTLTEACDYIKNDLVDVIPSTAAGYRALDFPGLENILLCIGKVAGVVLQAIGRTARGKHMNVITLASGRGRIIPVYTKGANERNEMLRKYYKFCDIETTYINDDILC
jgi:hypothetical protein